MAGIIEEIVHIEQRRAHGEYALGGSVGFEGVNDLERALHEAEHYETLQESYVGNVFKDGKDFHVDTAFLNSVGGLPGYYLRHGFMDDFEIQTKDGAVIDARGMFGKDFPGQSGKSFRLSPDFRSGADAKDVSAFVKKMVGSRKAKLVKKFKPPTPQAVAKRAGIKSRAKPRKGTQYKLYDFFRNNYDKYGGKSIWFPLVDIARYPQFSGVNLKQLQKSLDAMVKSGLLNKGDFDRLRGDKYQLAESTLRVDSSLVESFNHEPNEIDGNDISILAALSEEGGTLSAPDIALISGLNKNIVRDALVEMSYAKLVARIRPSSDVWRITHFGEACVGSHGKKKRKGKRKESLKEFKVKEYRKPSASSSLPEIKLRDKAAEKVVRMMLSKAQSQGGGHWVSKQKLQDKHLNILRLAARDRVFAVRRSGNGYEYIWGSPNARMNIRDDGSGKVLLKVQAFTNEAKEGSYKAQQPKIKITWKNLIGSVVRGDDKVGYLILDLGYNKVNWRKNHIFKDVPNSKVIATDMGKDDLKFAAKKWVSKNIGKVSYNVIGESKKGSYKAQGPLEKMVGEMVVGQSGKWLSKSQMKSVIAVLNKKGITEPSKNSYDDIARIVGKTLASLMKNESFEVRFKPLIYIFPTKEKAIAFKKLIMKKARGGKAVARKAKGWSVYYVAFKPFSLQDTIDIKGLYSPESDSYRTIAKEIESQVRM